jgi:hypothetical protein
VVELQDYRACAYTTVLTYAYVSEQPGACADEYPISYHGMPFTLLLACAAEGDVLINRYVIAHYAGFADHDTHAVVDEQAVTDLRSGMDLDSGHKTYNLGVEPCDKTHPMSPEPVAQPVRPERVQAWITEQHF